MVEILNVLRGWREEEYGCSRGGLPLHVQLPAPTLRSRAR